MCAATPKQALATASARTVTAVSPPSLRKCAANRSGLDEIIPGAADAGGVTGYEVTPVGQGVIADGFKVTVAYAGDATKALPAVVLKLSKDDAATKLENLTLCAHGAL